MKDITVDTLLQLQKILAYFEDSKTASIADIAKQLNVGEESIIKKIKMLKDDFACRFEHIGKEKRLHLAYDSQQVTDKIWASLGKMNLTFLAKNTQAFFEYLKSLHQNPFVRLDSVLFTDFSLVTDILKAIEKETLLQFDYQSMAGRQAYKRLVLPYLLREHKNRWYLLAWEIEKNKQRNEDEACVKFYSLDQIRNFEVYTFNTWQDKAKTIENPYKVGVIEGAYFENTYGLYINLEEYAYSEPSKIVLEFYGKAMQEVQARPFHKTQHITAQDANKLTLEITVYIDYYIDELLQDLASYGRQVKVIEPAHLATALKKYLQEAFSLYP